MIFLIFAQLDFANASDLSCWATIGTPERKECLTPDTQPRFNFSRADAVERVAPPPWHNPSI